MVLTSKLLQTLQCLQKIPLVTLSPGNTNPGMYSVAAVNQSVVDICHT